METEIRTEELKQLELGVLCYIRDKCRENGLKYYLMYGTLIGAVRHKASSPGTMMWISPCSGRIS